MGYVVSLQDGQNLNFELPSEFFDDPFYQRLRPNAKLLYAYISGRQKETPMPMIEISYEEFTLKLGICRATVTDAIRQLQQANLLTVDSSKPNKPLYTINEPCQVIMLPKSKNMKDAGLMDDLKAILRQLAS